MRRDTKHLERHGLQWRVRVKVPVALRKVIGRAHVVRPLHTDSLTEANRVKHRVVAEIKAEFEKVRRLGVRGFDKETLAGEAMLWREALIEAESRGDYEAIDTIKDALEDRAWSLAARRGFETDLKERFNGELEGRFKADVGERFASIALAGC